MRDTGQRNAATRLLDKLKHFAASLDDEERELLAALLAPGVAAAYDEVEGFGTGWSMGTLPRHLADAIEGRGLRIEGW